MVHSLARRFGAVAAVAALISSPVIPATTAEAAPSLTCRASISDATPQQYSDVYVYVRTAPKAKVRTVAHYKTTNTAHSRTADTAGRATIDYYISGSTPGYRVRIDVTVTKNGKSRTCSTSFRPHR